ncbi:MAG TPA: sugar phosphate nucleotidyltransferase [Chloroflexota bacterium]|nr:sugar phosphate nucleotidyltransferase [Chloroflexota bacterium]
MSQPLLPVAILAGGLAARLRPLTEAKPKALIEVAGEPFIAHQLRLLREQAVRDVVVCAGYLGEMIEAVVQDGRRYGVGVRYSYDGPDLLGTAGALKKALPLLGEAFFVLYGDSLLPCRYAPVQDAFLASGHLGLLTVFRNQGQWDASNVEYADGGIANYSKQQRTPAMKHIDYGLGVLRAAALDELTGPGDLAWVYQQLLARDQLAAYEVHERFYEVGSFAGIEETARYVESLR